MVFLNKMLTTFFFCTSPASNVAKPKCMEKTKMVEIIIHKLLVVKIASFIILLDLIKEINY